MAKRYIIIGSGAAGLEAATAIRTADSLGNITVVSEESWPYYSRIRIGEVVDGRSEPDKLALRLPNWYDEQKINLLLKSRVTQIVHAKKQVQLADGQLLDYDSLLIATGARPFVPNFPGSDLAKTLRFMADAVALRQAIVGVKRAVVIGGGLLGLELAASLAKAGLAVTVVERNNRLLPRQLDLVAGELVLELLQRQGIDFVLPASTAQIRQENNGLSVDMDDGCSLPADLVLVSAGVRPAIELAQAAGIEVDQGILINDQMQTSIPGIYAAGDCAEHRGQLYGIWPASSEQGRFAGRAMAGLDVTYAGTTRMVTLKVAEIGVFSMGKTGDEDGEVQAERSGDDYKRLVRDENGVLIGATLVGDLSERRHILMALTAGKPYP
ncbi:MAG TPA: FAD-dependent oxidoreductase [Myxococcota bacterium]|nr:FAD-dependent oxidoreductase [Myxococcota bacterium]